MIGTTTRKIPGVDDPADPDEVEDELEQLEEEGAIVTHHKGAEMAKEPIDKAEPKHEIPEDAELPRAGSINEPPGSNVLDRTLKPDVPEVSPMPPKPPSGRGDDDNDEDEDERGKGKKRR